MRRIYIAGPFRGATPWEVEENIREAERLALRVAREGDCPVCPHTMWRHFDKALPDEFWLKAALMLMDTCEGLRVVGDYERSEGTKREIRMAKVAGLEVLDELGGPLC